MPRIKSNVIRLRHMLDACQKALRFTRGKLRKDLDDDEQLTLALVRLIEILGEAAAKVTPDVQVRYTSIPWKEIIGTRNRLIHGYEDVNLDILWQIISSDLPPLENELQAIIKKEERN
jgi:uncharacterized protein with HEPN domain